MASEMSKSQTHGIPKAFCECKFDGEALYFTALPEGLFSVVLPAVDEASSV